MNQPAVIRAHEALIGIDGETGMRCPLCGCADTEVRDSRPANMHTIRRRRRCTGCGQRFTSYELAGDVWTLIHMAAELDTLVRSLRADDVALLRTIIQAMKKRGRS